MKNKKTAYLLVPLVLLVWGMIGWKVYAAMNKKENENMLQEKNEEIKNSGEKIPDTFELMADYRDPFLGKPTVPGHSKLNIQNSKLPVAKPTPKEKEAPSWPAVSYHGLIMRSGTEKKIGFLRVNGVSYFVTGGDEAGGLKIGRVSKDSVEVLMGKERKIVKK